jgi:hypothetical protein
LPVSLCLEQLRLWDRPPVAESRTRTWLQLGYATCALRQHDLERARLHLERARSGHGVIAATIETRLVAAYLASKRGDSRTACDALDELEPSLHDAALDADERACLEARWLDQRAYQALHPEGGGAPEFDRAERFYLRISVRDAPFFAACKRESGLAYVCFRTDRRAEAVEHAERACRHAGDGGFTRLRITALGLLAHVVGEPEGSDVRARAVRAAQSLEDEELVQRLRRANLGRLPERAAARSGVPVPRTTKRRTPS